MTFLLSSAHGTVWQDVHSIHAQVCNQRSSQGIQSDRYSAICELDIQYRKQKRDKEQVNKGRKKGKKKEDKKKKSEQEKEYECWKKKVDFFWIRVLKIFIVETYFGCDTQRKIFVIVISRLFLTSLENKRWEYLSFRSSGNGIEERISSDNEW